MEQKVVKCNNEKCGQHFMQTKKDMQCPFCQTKYVEGKDISPVGEKVGKTKEKNN